MGDTVGGLLGGGEETTESTSTVTPFQSDQFQLLLDEAERLYSSGGFLPESLYGGMDPIADRSPEQLAMIQQNLQGIQGLSGQGMQAASQALGPYDPEASGVSNIIDMVGRDINRNLTEGVLPGIGFGAQGAGQFGGSRQGIAEGLAARSAQEQFADAASDLRYSDYNAYQDRQQNVLGNLGSISQGLTQPAMALSDIERQDRQSDIDVALEEYAYANGLDLQNLQILKSLISGEMGGTSTGVQTQEGGGSGVGGILGSFAGSEAGSAAIAGMFSDTRLKENIKELGVVKGIKIYKWKWNDLAKELGLDSGQVVGVLAQEHLDSGAVATDSSGYYKVDYTKLFKGGK